MRIATWNVNSIKVRLPNVLDWLKRNQPDVLLLQEIKCETQNFPALEFESAGYKAHALGQKAYNGVAIITRHKAEHVREHLPEAGNDTQARYIEAIIQGVRVASIYLPNGNPVSSSIIPGRATGANPEPRLVGPSNEVKLDSRFRGNDAEAWSDKFAYKLEWLKRLKKHAVNLLKDEAPVVMGGDYNIIPEAADVYDPKGWENDALFHPQSRAAFREILHLGYTESFRALHPQKKHAYTFWDYQAGAFDRDAGLRIDHFLLSPEAADRTVACQIDRKERGKDKASDHTPVVLEIR